MLRALRDCLRSTAFAKNRECDARIDNVRLARLPGKGPDTEKSEAESQDEMSNDHDYTILRDFVRAYSSDAPPDILVFGDSVTLRVAVDDESSESFGDLLGRFLKGARQIHVVSDSGYHPGIFEGFCMSLSKLPGRPRLAVLPINLRSFSPTWDLSPLYQFDQETALLAGFNVDQPNYRLTSYGPDYDHCSRSVMLSVLGKPAIKLSEFNDVIARNPPHGSIAWTERLNTIFSWHYTCPLSPMHRKLRSLTRSVKLLNGIGVAVYCYFTPINYEAGIEYCGEHFRTMVDGNLAQIRHQLESVVSPPALPAREGVNLFKLDNLAFEFPKDMFFTPHNATEHLRYRGREFLVRRIFAAEQALAQSPTTGLLTDSN